MGRLFYTFLCLSNLINIRSKEIEIFIITNLDDIYGQSTAGAQWLAVEEINNRTDFLPNHTIKLQVYNANDRHQSVLYALNATQYQRSSVCSTTENEENNTIYLPMILGSAWSSLSISIASILGSFNMGQISAASTSIALSDTNKYKYFYRTIPSDSLQNEGIILMCNHFNWTSIGIVYVQDAYGLYGTIGIQELAAKNSIATTAIAISEEEDVTYKYAAQQIKELELYIVVILIHENNLQDLFGEFERANITGYPYLYIGTNSWIDGTIIKNSNLTNIFAGSIGTAPWQDPSMKYEEFANDNVVSEYINESIKIGSHFFDSWTHHFENGYKADLYYLKNPGEYAVYGYDAMYAVAHALQSISSNYDLIELVETDLFMKVLNDTLVVETDFIGATGHVIFDNAGDRLNGLYSLGNILSDGDMDYFGYFYQEKDGSIKSEINWERIIFPKYFTEKGILPRSEVLIHREIMYIDYNILLTMITLLGASIMLAIALMIMQIYFHKNKIIRAASWRLNIVMCFGAILLFTSAILYCFDERWLSEQRVLNLMCNVRFWMLSISMSILFIPLFSKTYRLGRMFKNILNNQVLNDRQLLFMLLFSVSIDIILLLIFTASKPLIRKYFDGDLVPMDMLQQTQFVYGSCAVSSRYNMMYALVLCWKGFQFMFGIYSAMNVSRIREMTHLLTKFDETGIQLISIFLTVTIIGISLVLLILIPDFKVQYVVIVIALLLIGNIVLCLNLMPRIFAVITNNEEKYIKTPAQRIEAKIKQELAKFSNGNRASLLSFSPSSKKNKTELVTVN